MDAASTALLARAMHQSEGALLSEVCADSSIAKRAHGSSSSSSSSGGGGGGGSAGGGGGGRNGGAASGSGGSGGGGGGFGGGRVASWSAGLVDASAYSSGESYP